MPEPIHRLLAEYGSLGVFGAILAATYGILVAIKEGWEALEFYRGKIKEARQRGYSMKSLRFLMTPWPPFLILIAAVAIMFLHVASTPRGPRRCGRTDDSPKSNRIDIPPQDLVAPYNNHTQEEGDRATAENLCAWKSISAWAVYKDHDDEAWHVIGIADTVNVSMYFKSVYSYNISRQPLNQVVSADCMINWLARSEIGADHCEFIPPPTATPTGIPSASPTPTASRLPEATPTQSRRCTLRSARSLALLSVSPLFRRVPLCHSTRSRVALFILAFVETERLLVEAAGRPACGAHAAAVRARRLTTYDNEEGLLRYPAQRAASAGGRGVTLPDVKSA